MDNKASRRSICEAQLKQPVDRNNNPMLSHFQYFVSISFRVSLVSDFSGSFGEEDVGCILATDHNALFEL